jgi:hypothetical protein
MFYYRIYIIWSNGSASILFGRKTCRRPAKQRLFEPSDIRKNRCKTSFDDDDDDECLTKEKRTFAFHVLEITS